MAKRFQSGIDIQVQVTTVGDDLLFHLAVKSQGIFECDRCCEIFQKDIEGDLHVVYTFDDMKVKAQAEQDDDIKLLPQGIHEIDITQDVIDALFLAVPVKNLCREQCKGLCPRCGTNLNEKTCACETTDIDPRWEALKDL